MPARSLHSIKWKIKTKDKARATGRVGSAFPEGEERWPTEGNSPQTDSLPKLCSVQFQSVKCSQAKRNTEWRRNILQVHRSLSSLSRDEEKVPRLLSEARAHEQPVRAAERVHKPAGSMDLCQKKWKAISICLTESLAIYMGVLQSTRRSYWQSRLNFRYPFCCHFAWLSSTVSHFPFQIPALCGRAINKFVYPSTNPQNRQHTPPLLHCSSGFSKSLAAVFCHFGFPTAASTMIISNWVRFSAPCL